MEINKKSRHQLRLQGAAFAVLFVAITGLVGWLSTRYHYQADWTASGRNSLTEGSMSVLRTLQGPVTITVFARDGNSMGDYLKRYQNAKPDLRVEVVNPDLHPEKVREYGVMVEGELTVEYQGRRENVQEITEQAITNALQRVAHGNQRPLLFLTGHGERNPNGQANHDLGLWGEQLGSKGFAVSSVNLAEKPQALEPGAVLIISTPPVNLLPGEVQLLRDFIEQGGSLLWLGDPGDLHGLKPVADALGVLFLRGTVVDPQAEALGNVTFAIVTAYGAHPAAKDLVGPSIFPMAAALQVTPPQGWEAAPLLRTGAATWNEITPISSVVGFDAGKDRVGPLTIGTSLTRQLAGANGAVRTQRVIVLGDGDFLSNSIIGNGANLDLGNRLVTWLSHDDAFINIPARAATDARLDLSGGTGIFVFVFFLLGLPGALLTTGVVIWMKRRKR